MSDTWRRKAYYRPRVLIETERVLDPQYPDYLLCITGSQIEMLRNLTQYLHRRSSFVGERFDGYYLAPTNDEWDDIEAIVADLEETLMGCEDITTALNEIAAQVACLCYQARNPPDYTPASQGTIEHYITEEQLQYNNPFPAATVVDEERCAVSQLLFQGAYEWLTELVQPVMDMTSDILMPMAMVLVASWCGATIILLPAGIVLAAIWRLIETWESGEMENVTNTLLSLKDEIICAVYEGLLIDAQTASESVKTIIYEQNLALGDKICLSLLCGPWMIGAAQAAWDEQSAWALINTTPGYCEICAQVVWPYFRSYYWPPCPGTWSGGFPCSSRSLPGINEDENGNSPEFELLSIAEDVIITVGCDWYSSEAIAWTVGYVTLQEYNTVVPEWQNVWSHACTNTATPGNLNQNEDTSPPQTITYNQLRWRIGGQAGQGAIDPYPFEPVKLLLTIVQDV